MPEPATRKIRVLVANKPRLMRDLVLTMVADQPDMEVVGDICEESEILEKIGHTRPDFLVVALESTNRRPPICDQALEKYPHLRVIAIASHGNSALYYRLSPDIRSSVINTSEGGVLGALRDEIDLTGR
jgi:chemotaxis response regulator CheB